MDCKMEDGKSEVPTLVNDVHEVVMKQEDFTIKENGEAKVNDNANGIGNNKTPQEKVSLSANTLRDMGEQESLEFAFLKPICAQVLQNPSSTNLRTFEAALNEVSHVPVHLSEYVAFPFAIHLKVIKTYKETQRIRIYQTLSKLLEKAVLCASFDVFINIFQKLHIALSSPPNVTTVNTQMSEEELEAIVTCIKNISATSLSYHVDTLCKPDKMQIFGHSIFMLLQLITPTVSKSIRLKTLETLEQFVKLCDENESRSKVLYKFLPGIVSALRKVCLPSAGNSTKAIIIKSLNTMGMTIKVSTEFETSDNLEQADGIISQIIELLSKDFVLNSDVDFRKAYFKFCCEITRKRQLPKCCKAVSTILMRMKDDDDSAISNGCVEALQTAEMLQNLGFPDLTNLVNSASTALNSGNDVTCVLTLREISSALSTLKLSFVEFQSFLPLLFQFVNEMIWKLRNVTVENKKTSDPVYIASCRVCQNLVLATDLDEVVFELISSLSDLQSNIRPTQSQTGVIVVFNVALPVIHEMDPRKISEFEAANLAEVYLSLLDSQSTEIALQSIEADIPAVQSAADIRRSYVLEGLGILGQLYPTTVVPLIIYPLLEHAGTSFQNSEIVNDIAETALKRLSAPQTVEEFLRNNLGLILNEVSVRMLNLLLYPNCPHAMAFLAQYFDFSNESFSGLIDQIFERCSDEFGGGNVQYIYAKVFYAVIKSIFNHFEKTPSVVSQKAEQRQTMLEKIMAYQKSVGVIHPHKREENNRLDDMDLGGEKREAEVNNTEDAVIAGNDDDDEVLSPVFSLVERICHRLLNFLPNSDRLVKLTAIDSLIMGLQLLKNNENSLLPLSHSIWQNLIPRIDEKDYVVVRKSFELLQTLCVCSGTFLRKRTIDEAFPKLSLLLLNLAKEGEQVKDKNRQYYTCTQAYKLQLTILQGMGPLLHSIDVQEFELDKIVTGCILYLKPNQHKNLREAARNLLKSISSGKHCRTVWMKLIACGFIEMPANVPDTSFAALPVVPELD